MHCKILHKKLTSVSQEPFKSENEIDMFTQSKTEGGLGTWLSHLEHTHTHTQRTAQVCTFVFVIEHTHTFYISNSNK